MKLALAWIDERLPRLHLVTGLTVFTRIPLGPYSLDSDFEKLASAALAAL